MTVALKQMPAQRAAPIDAEARMVPRPHQEIARDHILAARAEGKPGFLLGDITGFGKTLSIWSAILAMPENEVLIVCTRAGQPQWRRTIRLTRWMVEDDLARDKQVTITTYGRTKSLLMPLTATLKRSARAKNNELAKLGQLKRTWPIVVFDEAHKIRNPYSQQGMVCRKLADAALFPIFASATAGQTPHELSYLGRLLGHAAGMPVRDLAGFRDLMKKLKIGKAKGRWVNWKWAANDNDREVMCRLLYTGPRAIGLRRTKIDGWRDIQREAMPVALEPAAAKLYKAGWRDFRKELGLAGGSTRRPAGKVAEMRFRQKASLLRVQGTVDLAADLLDDGVQVAISVAFLETARMVEEGLRAQGWRVGQINGQQKSDVNEEIRLAFQGGALDAVVFTVEDSISLHQGEMPGGNRPRVQLIHDIRHSAIQNKQIEGRTNRDGAWAPIYYLFAEDTVEEKIAQTAVSRMASMDGMAGDDTSLLDAMLDQLEAAALERAAA